MRQIKRECASLAERAFQLDFAAQQVGQLAADGQSQSGSSKLPAGPGVGLLECLEDDALFLSRNANAGIFHLECNNRSGAIQNRVTGIPATERKRNRKAHTSLLGKFEGVR